MTRNLLSTWLVLNNCGLLESTKVVICIVMCWLVYMVKTTIESIENTTSGTLFMFPVEMLDELRKGCSSNVNVEWNSVTILSGWEFLRSPT